jgi:two-component system alkaline phosphatase synthesis response regulator PhoP
MQRRVLIVDDERDLRSMLSSYLAADGFEVIEAADGDEGLHLALTRRVDLVVLDVGLPGIDGFEVLRRLRSSSEVPVIMLTARVEEVDRVVGLTVGADDYVSKPFSPRELVARIGAVLRRTSNVPEPGGVELLEFEDLTIDVSSREVSLGEQLLDLSALEFDLLLALARAPRRVFSRELLMEEVWGWDYVGVDRVVDVHISNLRKLLGDDPLDPSFIATVRGVGYKFVGVKR